ncbi:tubulin--tyrosine ligase-like protein 12 [Condylostylus longicornis]|uniref:tubulin--tyrosine ligase-like protein 12 n=1 Tax=Condylostylus longicornis TaxID=2530218 RepID=UPI00244DE638|nr:tubulin--tyrosine ligase-like protein 12 [Condylostylus longicornis]
MSDDYDIFEEQHKSQLLSCAIPEHFWRSLHKKLKAETFDAGLSFTLMVVDNNDVPVLETDPVFALYVSKEEGIYANDPNEIYLIDHAWTFRANQVRPQLEQMPNLVSRMCAFTGVDVEDPNRMELLEKRIWKYCQSYSIQSEGVPIENQMPIWYIMDEVGSAVNHNDNPNFRIVPFIFLPTQTTYSLMFPIVDCQEGDRVRRNFIENISEDEKIRKALLLPWKHTDFTSESFEQEEPKEEYFTTGHIPEILPKKFTEGPKLNRDGPLKVYTEYEVVAENLNSSYFELVDDPNVADILWLTSHFKNYKELHENFPNRFINQFPYEYVITIKDLLSIVCKRRSDKHHDSDTLETYPKWLPTTYNLKTELVEFVSYFQHRQNKNLDNHWIIKPWNLARGLDTEITCNIWKIVRMQTTGPKIAQKYIENPVLFYRNDLEEKVKFDIRYVILLKSVQPLEAYIHRKFYLRFANKSFSLDNLHDYEKHFTVMNYNENTSLKHIRCEEFVQMWGEQYPKNNWDTIEENICKMFHEVLLCSIEKKPPCGIGDFKQSRALYAADLMLSWEGENNMQPKLLEINWMPDCKRACEYYPDFYNDIFGLLFLNEMNSEQFKIVK